MTRLRVKKGAWAPLRLRSMESCPATGMTRMVVMIGVWFMFGCGGILLVSIEFVEATGKPQKQRQKQVPFGDDKQEKQVQQQ